MSEAPPSRLKRFRLALALLMDETDTDRLVVSADHMDTVAGGVRIDYDKDRQEFIIVRFTGDPNPPPLVPRPDGAPRRPRRAAV